MINGIISISGDDIILFWIVLVAYLAVLVVFGIYSKKKTKSVEDYLTAGRSIGPILLGLSFGVTYFSSVLIIGGGGLAFVWGLASVWIAAIDVLVGVVLVFLFFGRRTKIISDKCKALTISQLIGYRYQDKNYQAFSGAVVMFFEMIYMVSMYVGLSKLLILLVPSDWSTEAIDNAYKIAVSLCAIITVVYLTAGGSFGAIYTDAFESMIMIVGVVVIAIYGLIAVGGVDGMLAGLQTGETIHTITNPDTMATFTIPFTTGSLTTFIGFGGMGILGYILVTSFGQWGMPQSLSRFFTSKSKKAVKYGAGIAAIWAAIVGFFAWFNGALAGSYWFANVALPGHDVNFERIIISLFTKDVEMNIPFFIVKVMPPAFVAIFIAAVVVAVMTSEEKVVLMSASGFSQDVYQNLKERKGEKIPDDKMLKITRLSTIVVIASALALALTKPGLVLALCMFAWSAMAATILVPHVFGLFWKRGTAKAAWISGIASLAAAVLWWFMFTYDNPAVAGLFYQIRSVRLTSLPFPIDLGNYYSGIDHMSGKFIKNGIHEFIISQVVAVILFPIVSLKTQPPNEGFLTELFREFNGGKDVRGFMQQMKSMRN